MGRLIQWDDVMNRYPELAAIGDASIVDAAFIQPAEYWIEAQLASVYETPFTTTNYTARDLSIDEVYLRMIRNKYPKKAEAMQESLDARIQALLDGTAEMIDDGATAAEVASPMWSSTMTYNPVFDMGSILDAEVDPDQLADEEDARR